MCMQLILPNFSIIHPPTTPVADINCEYVHPFRVELGTAELSCFHTCGSNNTTISSSVLGLSVPGDDFKLTTLQCFVKLSHSLDGGPFLVLVPGINDCQVQKGDTSQQLEWGQHTAPNDEYGGEENACLGGCVLMQQLNAGRGRRPNKTIR